MQEKKTSGADILREAYELIVGPRQTTYSHPADDYARTADIFGAMTGHHLTLEEAVLFMIAVKLSRLLNEIRTDQWVPDNTRDLLGYVGCLHMIRTEGRHGIS